MSSALLKLKQTAPGSSVSVVAPASYAADERLAAGLARLHAFGFTCVPGKSAKERGPAYFAGTHAARLADLHSAFAAPTSAVFAVRGGYGSNYLLPHLDYELIRKHPKPFFAYSDLTGIQLHLLDRLGLPSFHGPMVAADFGVENGVHVPSFDSSMRGESYDVGAREGLRVLRPGNEDGILYGGCLSIITAMLGTPYEPETEGKLLFLEDVAAKPYQVDRMLWQMRTAGKLRGVKGIVFGEMLDCVPPGNGERIGSTKGGMLDDVIQRCLDDFTGPIAIGLRSGHVTRENVTLTFGVRARLTGDGNGAQLKFLESAIG